ncbi:putative GINS complex, subunit Psf3, GINS subunit, domain A, GINS complex, subunit Psf3 superfamily [Helianthus annuus]|uniref:GINS complex, subunit Psf3, GINS subunit, domain A, GINS complex, subunit Psf3 superfamily n=2 Tax=Helianthus annuus TaxID=4232 RepID=A0A9K3JWT7_HELAN|nr:putative GINS complex, subunit Psf3, GINS subunit, domain A, GINS complex, subunit Psf3 superfamily [Helianthus annuus]KAJ0612093.1 putative GINS complex, subunit Psf3, GINS subunit, domain A, GINS complex, subunit Psf3 superfamily [Helianthus annuus]KAJ0627446.1 putative GINS complex, subunit Psf3, GINS subunit, domain A, GINS complex, subunit Psf3 superfamily [Helianthus annuus]KAJ0948627.1 putative GINS complex, subunit Psf3, GINS subunit, domain A, GINS complex, subunit Psf3 superfamily [
MLISLLQQIEPRSKVELPFWLASELHLRQAASVTVPPCFNKKTREEIGADGAHVDLTRCSYFYQLGCKIVQSWRMGGPRFQKALVLGRKRKSTGE